MSAPPPLHLLPAPVTPDFRHALGGIWRLTWRRVTSPLSLGIGATLLALLALLIAVSVDPGDGAQWSQWVVRFFLTALVPVTAFLGGAGAIRDDMQGVAVDYILTRPVRRTWYVIGKYVCQVGTMLGLQLPALAVLLGVGLYRDVPGLGAAVPDLLGALVVAVVAFTALGFLLGTVTARYLALGIFYAAVVEIGLGRIPIQLSKLSVLRHLETLLADVGAAGAGAAGLQSSPATAVVLVAGLTLIWVAASAVIFSRQEFAGQRPKEG